MKLKQREEAEEKYKWSINDIFENDEAFLNALEKAKRFIGQFLKFKGKLEEKETLLTLLKENSKCSLELERLYAYAKMKLDEDTAKSKYQSFLDKVTFLFSNIETETAFIIPELASKKDDYLKSLINEKDFNDYSVFLKGVLRTKSHTLSFEEEKVLAQGAEVFGGFSDIFENIDNADLKFGTIKDESGEEIELSHSRYGMLLMSEDENVRKEVYEKYYNVYKGLINTITSTYLGSVKKDVFIAKARHFKSALEKAMFYEEVDKKVYENLLSGVKSGLDAMHEYVDLRKKALNKDELHFYDMYVPIVKGTNLQCDFEEAFKLVKEGLAPLGEDYACLLTKAYDEKWMDVYNNAGKRSGAYSFGVYGVHPYVLLNHEKTTHDIFTIAHELGHAMHSYYSNENQPYEKADYTIFVAEVASTVNEVLLLKHIINKTKDINLKKYLLSYFLDMFRTTLFRQTMFAEFECYSHGEVEKGSGITKDDLCEYYEKLNKKYYGENIVHDDFIKYEWARIPHFYRAFYVYKYATGLTSAIKIATNILEKGDEYVKKYKEFLSSGCTADPVSLLKIAGVDLMSEEPFANAMFVFKETLETLKTLI